MSNRRDEGYNYYGEGGLFPTPTQPRFSDPHPWRTSLRDMKMMLDEEIELPHKAYETTYSDGRVEYGYVNHKLSDTVIKVTPTISCIDCHDAYDLQQRYKVEKLKLQEQCAQTVILTHG